MAEIMGQAYRFFQIFIATQSPGDGPPDLSDFKRMGQAGAIIISLSI
jgi:hypothetical protein